MLLALISVPGPGRSAWNRSRDWLTNSEPLRVKERAPRCSVHTHSCMNEKGSALIHTHTCERMESCERASRLWKPADSGTLVIFWEKMGRKEMAENQGKIFYLLGWKNWLIDEAVKWGSEIPLLIKQDVSSVWSSFFMTMNFGVCVFACLCASVCLHAPVFVCSLCITVCVCVFIRSFHLPHA